MHNSFIYLYCKGNDLVAAKQLLRFCEYSLNTLVVFSLQPTIGLAMLSKFISYIGCFLAEW